MVPRKLITVIGAFAIIAGLVFAGIAAQPALPASAGEEECPEPTNTPDPTPTFQGTLGPQGDLESFGLQCTATPEREDRDTRTPTPTKTSTQEPEDPTNTPAPPTATPPGGAVGAGGVQPPNTGSGPNTGAGATVDGGGVSIALVMMGTVLALAGGGAVAFGLRRK